MASIDFWQGVRLAGARLAGAPRHIVPTRELSAAMRQIRAATGDSQEASAEVLNATLRQLYPDIVAADDTSRSGGRHSRPHLVTQKYLSNVERATNARLRVPPWLRRSGVDETADYTWASRVRPWLVRAYDVAFGGDGYLIAMHAWANAMRADQRHFPPRRTRNLPTDIPPGAEFDVLRADLPDAPDHVLAILREQAEELRARRARWNDQSAWHPSRADRTGTLGDGDLPNPEGMLVRPGEYRVVRWVVHNTGGVPWRDRLLFPVGLTADGPKTVPFLPIPDTDPDGTAEVRCVVRAPERPGTYRFCVKAMWPNGVHCFPTLLLGLIYTATVPPDDLGDCYEEWAQR